MNRKILLIIFALILISVDNFVDCQSSSSYRLRRRCPTVFPTHSQLMNSNSVVLIGIVEYIRPLDNLDLGFDYRYSQQQQQQQQQQPMPTTSSSNYLANVLVRRVLHGPRSLQHQRVQVTGFRSNEQNNNNNGKQSWCYSNTRQGDSWIFVLQPINYPDQFRLNSSLIKLTLSNIERFDSIIADQPFGLRMDYPELPCERKYCANNANCINDQYSSDGARCECLQHCNNQINNKYQPICGSDNETYNNECELRLRSCRMNKNLFVKSINSCYYNRNTNTITSYIPPSTSLSSSSSSSSSSSYRSNNQYQTHRTTSTTENRQDSYRMNRSEYPLPSNYDKNIWRQQTNDNNNNNRHTITTTTINRSYSY